jgi:hypothetical protein
LSSLKGSADHIGFESPIVSRSMSLATAGSMATFATTIDQVFKGDPAQK